MEVEIKDPPELTGEQAALIDMHGAVNILNVLLNELEYLQEVLREQEPLQPALEAVQEIQLRLRSSDDVGANLGSLLKCQDRVMEVVHAAVDAHRDAGDDADVRDSVSNLESVFTVLDTRARELLERVRAPGEWTVHDVAELTENFTKAYVVARRFGGKMWIDSSPGAGTRITLSIPRPAA